MLVDVLWLRPLAAERRPSPSKPSRRHMTDVVPQVIHHHHIKLLNRSWRCKKILLHLFIPSILRSIASM